MPAKDIAHQAVKHALQKEDWVITADPLYIHFLDADMWVDLAAEKVIPEVR